MKKFLAIYTAPTAALKEMMKTTTPEKEAEWKNSWKTWMDAHKASFTDQGTPVGKNMRVTSVGAAATPNDINGYSIVEADSQEEAAKIFLENPQLQMPGAYIEVMPLSDMGGM